MAEVFPYSEDIRRKCEAEIYKLCQLNDEHDLGLTYSAIGRKVDEKFGIDWFKYDSERVRNVKRKFERQQIQNQISTMIAKIPDDEAVVACKPRNKRKVLVMGDLHSPFERSDVLDIVRKHKDEIKALVLAGDLFDCFSISSFPKIKRIMLEEELVHTYNLVKGMRDILPDDVEIIIFKGNHEDRLLREIAKQQATNNQLMSFINPKIVENLIDGFVLYNDLDKKVYEPIRGIRYVHNYYININNQLIIIHPKNFSGVDVKNVKMAIEHMLHLKEQFDAVLVVHTHRQGDTAEYLGKYGAEIGCMCQHMEYTEGRTSSRPQHYGYAIVEFPENGAITKNHVHIYRLEPEVDIKERAYVDIKFV